MDHFDRKDRQEAADSGGKSSSGGKTPQAVHTPQQQPTPPRMQQAPAMFQRSFVDGDFDFVRVLIIYVMFYKHNTIQEPTMRNLVQHSFFFLNFFPILTVKIQYAS